MKVYLLKKIRKLFDIKYIKKPSDGKPIILKGKGNSFEYRCSSVENALYQACYIGLSRKDFSRIYKTPINRKLKRNGKCKR